MTTTTTFFDHTTALGDTMTDTLTAPTTTDDFTANNLQRDRAAAINATWVTGYAGHANPTLLHDYDASYGYLEVAARRLGINLDDADDIAHDRASELALKIAVADGAVLDLREASYQAYSSALDAADALYAAHDAECEELRDARELSGNARDAAIAAHDESCERALAVEAAYEAARTA